MAAAPAAPRSQGAVPTMCVHSVAVVAVHRTRCKTRAMQCRPLPALKQNTGVRSAHCVTIPLPHRALAARLTPTPPHPSAAPLSPEIRQGREYFYSRQTGLGLYYEINMF